MAGTRERPEALEKRVLEVLTTQAMLAQGDTVLCAVSGGADSLCLLRILCSLRPYLHYSLEAATFDHRIRAEGAADAAFVERRCAAWGIPCHRGSADVPAAARSAKAGLEETARRLRYAFLEQTADQIGAQRIATAHNADDNAETLLLHLLRGSGLQGLGGIAPMRGRLIRPLLTVSRAEIEAYCAATGTPYVEDATNADRTYTRNYLRHEVLPLLREKNPRLLTTLGRTAQALRRDSECLEQQAEALLHRATLSPRSASYPVPALLALPEALSLRLVQQMAARLVPQVVLTAAQRERVLRLCRSEKPSAACTLTGALRARREYDALLLWVDTPAQEPETVLLQPGERVSFHGRTLHCALTTCPEGRFNQPHHYYLRGTGPLLLRAPRPGDRITLPNRPPKAVKKLLSDSKHSRFQRPLAIVLEQDGVLLALDGYGADIHHLPKPGERCRSITSTALSEEPTAQSKEGD